MKEKKNILEQLFILIKNLEDIKLTLINDSIDHPFNVKYEYLCIYKQFLEKNDLISIKTYLGLFKEQNLGKNHFQELQNLINELLIFLNEGNSNLKKYIPYIHGGNILNKMLDVEYTSDIRNIDKAIKSLKEENFSDPCTSEYNYRYLIQEQADRFKVENNWLYTFNPYKDLDEIFIWINNFINQYIVTTTSYFSLENSSIIYKLCNGTIFEESNDIDFFLFINLIGSKIIGYKKKDKTCHLIHILLNYIITSNSFSQKKIWESEMLTRLDIEEKYYRKKYKRIERKKSLSLEECITIILEDKLSE